MKILTPLGIPDYYEKGYAFGHPNVVHNVWEWWEIVGRLWNSLIEELPEIAQLNLVVTGASGVSISTLLQIHPRRRGLFYKTKKELSIKVIHVRKPGEPTSQSDISGEEEFLVKNSFSVFIDDHIGSGGTLTNLYHALTKKGKQNYTGYLRGIVTLGENILHEPKDPHQFILNKAIFYKNTYFYNLEFFTQAEHMFKKMNWEDMSMNSIGGMGKKKQHEEETE